MNYEVLLVTPFQQNCTLIWQEGDKTAVVIDPGADTNKILTRLSELGLTLDKILLTHGHLDHVGAAAELRKKSGAPIIGPHKDDDFWLQQLAEQANMLQLPKTEVFEPDQWLNHDDLVVSSSLTFKVLHTPGHTPGHICFWNEQENRVWSGDLLFRGSVGRTDFPKSDSGQLFHSCREVLFPLGDDVTVHPGHGPETTIGFERVANPFVGDE